MKVCLAESLSKKIFLKIKKDLLQVRLELTTPAYLCTVYKYRALTDCATGAGECKNKFFNISIILKYNAKRFIFLAAAVFS